MGYKLVDVDFDAQEKAAEIIARGNLNDERMKGKMAKEIVPLVISGEISEEEAASFLLARTVRKYTS